MSNQLTFSVPLLRFEEFKDEWQEVSLGDLVESFEYGLNASSKVYDGKNKYLRITDINEVTRKFLTDNLTSPNVNLSLSSNYILEERDVLFARTGASVGKTYIYEKTDGNVYFAGFLIRARIKKEYCPKFIFQNTLTGNYNNFVKVTSQRSGQPGINAQEYANYKFKIPSLDEQKKIGSFFKYLDDTISLHQQELEALKQTKQGFLQKMFPKDGETEPAVRFEKYTENWQLKKLGDILKVNSGRDYKHLGTGNIPVYGTGGFMLNVNESLSNEDAIGLGRKGTIDKPQLLKAPFWTVDTLFFMTMKKDIDLHFCYSLINMISWKKYDESTGVPSLSKTNIDKILVKVPSYEEQLKIGEFFKQLDEVIELKEKEIEALKETKKGFLQKMFV